MELQIQDSISFCCPVFLYTIPIYGAADIMITAAASTGASIFSHCLKNILYDSPAISHIPRLVDSGYSPHTKFIPHVNTDSRTVCPPAAPTADAEKRQKPLRRIRHGYAQLHRWWTEGTVLYQNMRQNPAITNAHKALPQLSVPVYKCYAHPVR